MKMTIRQALDYIQKSDGMKYSEELENKVDKFLKNLPHNPKLTGSFYRHDIGGLVRIANVVDYERGWYAIINYWKNESDNTFNFKIVDGDGVDPNRQVKSNRRAIELIEELNNIRYASDIDEYWQYSDDHKYVSKMREISNKANLRKVEIVSLLEI